MLDNLNLLDKKVQNLVKILIKSRNKVAHGRQVYQDKVIWPLPPFFPLTDIDFSYIQVIKTLTARTISMELGLGIWENRWNKIHNELYSSVEEVRSFIKNKDYMKISEDEFFQEDNKEISLAAITEYYIKGKLNYIDIKKSLNNVIKKINLNNQNINELAILTIFFADDKDNELARKSKKIIKKCSKDINYKEILMWLEYEGLKPNWLRKWIMNGSKI